MWQTECTINTVNADVVNKIILKMPHQHIILQKINLSILNPKKKKRIKIQKIHKFRAGFIFNKNTMNTNPDLKYKNTPKFLAFSCPFLSTKHKNINTQNPGNQWTQGSEELHL